MEKHEGKRATFALRVLFRQNASWQGSVTWLEGGQEESFRSVLELLMLMNSALTEEENNGKRPGRFRVMRCMTRMASVGVETVRKAHKEITAKRQTGGNSGTPKQGG